MNIYNPNDLDWTVASLAIVMIFMLGLGFLLKGIK